MNAPLQSITVCLRLQVYIQDSCLACSNIGNKIRQTTHTVVIPLHRRRPFIRLSTCPSAQSNNLAKVRPTKRTKYLKCPSLIRLHSDSRSMEVEFTPCLKRKAFSTSMLVSQSVPNCRAHASLPANLLRLASAACKVEQAVYTV